MNWDHAFHIVELTVSTGGVAILWRGVRALNRFTVHLEEYPLHRHVGRQIIYPKGLSPEEAKSDERIGVGV
jgi:hypothetical protein